MEQSTPPVDYARAGGLRIAYQVVGDGPIDVLFTYGFASHLEIQWEHPAIARFYRRLTSFSRLLLFDRRGTGLSDRGSGHRFEDTIDDISAVLDAVGSQKVRDRRSSRLRTRRADVRRHAPGADVLGGDDRRSSGHVPV